MRNVIRRIKSLLRAAAGKDIFVKPNLVCASEQFGSDYGGWNVVTADLDHNGIVYSFGIGEDASFDIALIERFELKVHAFDPTPKSIDWVNNQDFSDRVILHEYGIASFDGTISFNPPENPDHVSFTVLERPSTAARAIVVPVHRLSTIMKELSHDRIDVLKMDIEGAEYDVIDDLRKSEVRPHQILVEFHTRFPGVGAEKTRRAIETQRSMDYRLFSVSPTNQELCFVLNCG